MEHKPIYLDGVDVSKCEFYMHYDYGRFSHGCSLHKDMFGLPVYCDIADCCEDCYFKQLARKTQECEGLKKQLGTSEEWRIKAEGLNEKLELKNTRYRKALEEIEKVINNILNSCLGRNTVSCRPAHNVCGDLINILDIINKAKGEGNE